MSDVAELVGKLLRKAEATTSTDEAEALYAKAQALATAHAIDLAVARANVASKEAREQPEERTLKLTEPGMRSRPQFVTLFNQIAASNDVAMLISTDSTTVFPMGLPSDLDMVEQLYLGLAAHMVRAANAYLATGEHRERGVHGQTARRNFYDGFAHRIGQRLKASRAEAVREAEHDARGGRASARAGREADGTARGRDGDDPGALSVTALALRDKTKEVTDFYEAKKAAYNVRRSWAGLERQQALAWSPGAWTAGSAAGASAPLSGTRSIGR